MWLGVIERTGVRWGEPVKATTKNAKGFIKYVAQKAAEWKAVFADHQGQISPVFSYKGTGEPPEETKTQDRIMANSPDQQPDKMVQFPLNNQNSGPVNTFQKTTPMNLHNQLQEVSRIANTIDGLIRDLMFHVNDIMVTESQKNQQASTPFPVVNNQYPDNVYHDKSGYKF